ncbi:MAG TPA: nuclear transport factor 2 family protein [Devosia sp.]|nr:nuclear transport factor 2 family protein [Devosia sp.]
MAFALLSSLAPVAAQTIDTAPAATLAEAATPEYAARTEQNRAAFLDFVQLYYSQHQIRPAFEKHVAADYIQHNPEIANGREAAIAWLEIKMASATVKMDVRRIVVDGDYAVVHLLASQGPEDPGHAIMNIFRLKDGKIVEHWDVTQAIPAMTASGNDMG